MRVKGKLSDSFSCTGISGYCNSCQGNTYASAPGSSQCLPCEAFWWRMAVTADRTRCHASFMNVFASGTVLLLSFLFFAVTQRVGSTFCCQVSVLVQQSGEKHNALTLPASTQRQGTLTLGMLLHARRLPLVSREWRNGVQL